MYLEALNTLNVKIHTFGCRYSSYEVKFPFVHCVQGSQITVEFESTFASGYRGFHARFYSNGMFIRS